MKNDNLDVVFSVGSFTVSILKFSYERLPQNMPSHAHSSNSYEIHYIPQGRGSLVTSHGTYDLYPNVLYTTGPHIEHAQFSDSADPMYEYCIYLKVEEMKKCSKADIMNNEKALQQFLAYPFWYGVDHTDLSDVLRQIHTELSEPGTATFLLLQSLFMNFMVKMLRNYDNSSKAAIASIPVPLIKAYILIEDSFLYEYGTITLEELAGRLGLSVRQTNRILYSKYKKNFTQKRIEARMAAAATFLQENTLSLAEISERLGYSCTNHFYAAFKKYYHTTPSQYRAQLRDQIQGEGGN